MACGGVFLRVLAQVRGDAELQRREESRCPIRIGIVEAGAAARSIAPQLKSQAFAWWQLRTERRNTGSGHFGSVASRVGAARNRLAKLPLPSTGDAGADR